MSLKRNHAGEATLSGVPVAELVARAGVPTPAYLYDLDAIGARARAFDEAFHDHPHVVCYALKANTAGSVVRAVGATGCGADVVSGGELAVALGCGIPGRKVVMSGVGKLDRELDQAIAADILAIQAESVEELVRTASRARAVGKPARVSLRVNPSVSISSHAHIQTGHDKAKFGIARGDLAAAWEAIDGSEGALIGVGVSTHVGSMLTEPAPYRQSASVVCDVAKARRATSRTLEYIDFGGGFGIDYTGDTTVASPDAFVTAALATLRAAGLGDLALVIEPGRSMVAPFGVLASTIIQRKVSGPRRWVVVDAGMNDLLRPALYQARHRAELATLPPAPGEWRVVGPVCESSDDFGAFDLGEAPEGLVLFRDAGAYAFTMASEYNGRPLPAEIFVAAGEVAQVVASPGVDAWVTRRLQA